MDNFFKDKDGNYAIAQKPNWSIIAAFVSYVLYKLSEESASEAFRYLYLVLLTYWALDEVLRGDSLFRRVLGAVVLVFAVLSSL